MIAAAAAAAADDNVAAWLSFFGVIGVAIIGLIGIRISQDNGRRTKQLEPNGGSSLADAVRRIEREQKAARAESAEAVRRVEEEQRAARAESAESKARIEAVVDRIDKRTENQGAALWKLNDAVGDVRAAASELTVRVTRIEERHITHVDPPKGQA